MILEYYPDTDMVYIRLAEGVSTESEEIAPGVVLDFGERNRLLGVEIEDASKLMDVSRLELRAFPLASLVLTREPAFSA